MNEDELKGDQIEVNRADGAAAIAASEAEVLAKNIIDMVKRLNVFEGMVSSIRATAFSKASSDAKVGQIVSILSSEGNRYELEEQGAEVQARPTVSSTASEAAGAVAKTGIGAIALAAAIPFLLSNPEILNIAKSFFDGFLNGLGISTEALSFVKPAIGAVLAILAASFVVGAFNNVIETFQKLKALAAALGIAGSAVNESGDNIAKKESRVNKKEKDVKKERKKIDAEKEEVKKSNDIVKDEVKKSKDEIKKAKSAGKGSKTRIGKFYEKLKALRKSVVPRLAEMGKNIVRSLPLVGTILGIGLVLYELYSISKDVYDVFSEDEKAENDEKKQAESKPSPAVTPTPTATPSPAPVSRATTTPTMAAPAPSADAAAVSSTLEVKPTTASTTPPPEAASASTANISGPDISASIPATNVEPSPPPSYQAVAQQSLEVDRAERDYFIQQSSVIMNINNTQVIHAPRKSAPAFGPSTFSVSVGA